MIDKDRKEFLKWVELTVAAVLKLRHELGAAA